MGIVAAGAGVFAACAAGSASWTAIRICRASLVDLRHKAIIVPFESDSASAGVFRVCRVEESSKGTSNVAAPGVDPDAAPT